jgi:hypothetical protein
VNGERWRRKEGVVEILEWPSNRTNADVRRCCDWPMLATIDRPISVVAIWVGAVESRFSGAHLGGCQVGSCALGPQLNACPLMRQGHTEIGRRDACGKERFPPSQFSVGHGID